VANGKGREDEGRERGMEGNGGSGSQKFWPRTGYKYRVYMERKCAENYKRHNIFFLNSNQHVDNFKP